jgi:hypothetical protein
MRRVAAVVAVGLLVSGCPPPRGSRGPAQLDGERALPAVAEGELRRPEDVDVIRDPAARSRAMFLEASRVFLHPRCANCHPDGDTPLQGLAMTPHDPPVLRGPGGKGVVGLECTSCHQTENAELARVPGAPGWHLAPREMAWVGKSPRHICEQIKDKERNGGKSMRMLIEHNGKDSLVAWGWRPGQDREPAPGDQQQFAALFEAWVDTGAHCPLEGDQPLSPRTPEGARQP